MSVRFSKSPRAVFLSVVLGFAGAASGAARTGRFTSSCKHQSAGRRRPDLTITAGRPRGRRGPAHGQGGDAGGRGGLGRHGWLGRCVPTTAAGDLRRCRRRQRLQWRCERCRSRPAHRRRTAAPASPCATRRTPRTSRACRIPPPTRSDVPTPAWPASTTPTPTADGCECQITSGASRCATGGTTTATTWSTKAST